MSFFPQVTEAAEAAAAPMLRERELQQLWFATLRTSWSSLVVMDTHPGGGALEVAKALADVGGVQRGSDVRLIEATGAELGRAASIISEMTTHVLNGGLAVAAVDPVVQSQTGVPIAMAADAVLLVVTLGRTGLDAVERTVELVGRERILGCVALHPAA
ncbi:MAG: hypothetical protein L0Y64_02865 [Myxococcaceae bacterium]|nr:hypothetical protein [Myxococcaceae bacterium]